MSYLFNCLWIFQLVIVVITCCCLSVSSIEHRGTMSFFNKFRPTVHPLPFPENGNAPTASTSPPKETLQRVASAEVRIPIGIRISGAARRFGSGVSDWFSKLFGKGRGNPKVAVGEDKKDSPTCSKLLTNELVKSLCDLDTGSKTPPQSTSASSPSPVAGCSYPYPHDTPEDKPSQTNSTQAGPGSQSSPECSSNAANDQSPSQSTPPSTKTSSCSSADTSGDELEIVRESAASSDAEEKVKDNIVVPINVIDRKMLQPVLGKAGKPVVIGEGTFGKVYLRRYRKKLVIEKKMTNKKGFSARILDDKVRQEVEALQAVADISGFPTLHGVLVKDKRMGSIIMEFFSNYKSTKSYTLADINRREGPHIEKHQILKIMEDVTYALHEQQEADWLHCDIKSNNIVIKRNKDNSFSGKVVDFGLCKKISEMPFGRRQSFKPSNYVDNCVRYPHIAPEILKGYTGDTFEGEVYSLGYLLKNAGWRFSMPKMIKMSQFCMQSNPKKRPIMPQVLITLNMLKENEKRDVLSRAFKASSAPSLPNVVIQSTAVNSPSFNSIASADFYQKRRKRRKELGGFFTQYLDDCLPIICQ